MKKHILSMVLFIFAGFSFELCSAPFVFGYNEDFEISVSVPDTSSSIKKKADKMDKTMTALELTQAMGNGINLGNTLEAYRGWNGSTTKPVLSYERLWGQPETNGLFFFGGSPPRTPEVTPENFFSILLSHTA